MNILFTSVGRSRSSLIQAFIDELKGEGLIHAANSHPYTPVFEISDKCVITPLIHNDEYIPFLINYCVDNKIHAIIPLLDVDLTILSQNKSKFNDIGVNVVVSDEDVIQICNDKWCTYNYCIDNNFLTPKTYLSLEDVYDDLNSSKIEFPLIIKPRWGYGSVGYHEVNNLDELKVLYLKVKNDILKTSLKYESTDKLDESILIQEKLIGKEYNLDIIHDLSGTHYATVIKQICEKYIGQAIGVKITTNTILEQTARQISDTLHPIGNLDVDIMMVENKPYILDLNGRFGGSWQFGYLAGSNVPLAIIKWLNNESIDKSIFTLKEGMIMYKDEIIRELTKISK